MADSMRASLVRCAAWFTLAAAFGGALGWARGADAAFTFGTAYVVEQALSVDNLFVMMIVFAHYRVPPTAQRRVLTWGIAGVIVLRGVMIASGTALVDAIHGLVYVLGGFLLITAVRLALKLGAREPEPEPEAPRLAFGVRALVGRILPLTADFSGDRFTIVRDGIRYATPLLLAVVAIELADAVFALDSIPAVLGITTDPLIVCTSNLFAVLGLRSLYFVLAGALDRLHYLQHGIVIVLGLVGAKLVLSAWWHMPTWLSLALVVAVLGVAVVASLARCTKTK